MLTITTMSKCSSIKKTKDNLNKDKDINLFYQFFIHSNKLKMEPHFLYFLFILLIQEKHFI